MRSAALAPRRICLLDGPAAELHAAAARTRAPGDETLWLGGPRDDGVHANRIVGRDLAVVVVDATTAVDANRLGAALGALRAGGLLLWLRSTDRAPPAASVLRAERLLTAAVDRGEANAAQVHGWSPPTPAPSLDLGDEADAATPTQQTLAGAVCEYLRAPGGVLAIAADRGRGKSAALGLGCADALAALPAGECLFVTAAQPTGTRTLLRHARARCQRLGLDAQRIRHVAPEALLETPPPRLVVDEAATLGAQTLRTLADRVPRLVLASTEHGYEGTGQAFRLRVLGDLRERLAMATPARALSIERPTEALRFRAGDVLEQLTAELLLLDVEPSPHNELRARSASAVASADADRAALPALVPVTRLREDEAVLRGLFGTLREAHYQTRPADLFRMLDDPALRCWASGPLDGAAGCALTIDEGGLDADLAAAMVRGERRPRGHLGPGVIAERLGFAAGATLRSVRVNRIVVHASLRRGGLGARLLEAIAADARARGCDLVTSSFAADDGLVAFWTRAGFTVLRTGERRHSSSGTPSAFVARPCSIAGTELIAAALREARAAAER